ncbi:hypothetical protein LUZ60_010586 [Juncus effusus]|nr:hypothetical protein LUZ60_010586 [Juncus effusus]
MEGIQASNAVRNRLALQQEVLKWVVGFSEKVETRAESTTKELNELIDQSSLVELEMKNTLISFDNLQNINHSISDVVLVNEDQSKSISQSSIPAQDYENDILPRYKEALSLGLASCDNVFKNKNHRKGSVLRAMSAHNPLPYIIGSEEYTHDDSCGLSTDEFALGNSRDEFNWINEPNKDAFLDPEISDLFDSQHVSNKGEAEPYVRAALDFKSMLEAALLNPYKFYDNASGDNSNSLTRNTEFQDEITPIRQVETSSDNTLEKEENENLNYLRENIYSSLVTGSLFDTDDHSEIIEEINEKEKEKVSPDET